MFKRFYPDIYVNTIFDIPFNSLLGIRGLVFDIDNTLAPFDEKLPAPRTHAFIENLQSQGFCICLLSNNSEERVVCFNELMQLPCVSRARKPALAGVRRAMALIGTSPAETAIIGDQVFTDVWCGNRLGLFTVLVKPMSSRDEFMVRIKRGAEKFVLNTYLKREKRVTK